MALAVRTRRRDVATARAKREGISSRPVVQPHGYVEARFEVGEEWFDLLAAALQECGCLGIEYRDGSAPERLLVLAYFHEDAPSGSLVERLLMWLRAHEAAEVHVGRVQEQNWHSLWRGTYRPVEVDSGIVVLPSWSRARYPGRLQVKIKPDFAFGTGSHETTRLCLEALQAAPLSGRRVADVGTGSGILAIAAAKLGARSVYACDPDPWALVNARHNIRLNRVTDRVELVAGDLAGLPACRFDAIVANLVLEPLRAGVRPLARACRRGASVWVSGLVKGQERAWVKLAAREGLVLESERTKNDWLLLHLRARTAGGSS